MKANEYIESAKEAILLLMMSGCNSAAITFIPPIMTTLARVWSKCDQAQEALVKDEKTRKSDDNMMRPHWADALLDDVHVSVRTIGSDEFGCELETASVVIEHCDENMIPRVVCTMWRNKDGAELYLKFTLQIVGPKTLTYAVEESD